jgi:hypothetical protein
MRASRCIVILAGVWSVSMWGQSPPAANDWVIVPGVRVGPITATSVPEDLRRLFPADTVEDDEIELDEGMLQPATLVFKKTPSEALAISWNGKGPQAHPKQIYICFGRRRGPCRWQSSGGIKVGTRLSELTAMNGKPFTVSGFGWNYGGNVLSWEGGALAKLDCNGRLVVTLDGERVRAGEYAVKLTAEEVRSFSGDRPIPTSNAALEKLDPRVVDLLYQFAGPESKKCE